MREGTALYVGRDIAKQVKLGNRLVSIGIELHKASSTPAAKQKLCKHEYDLLLIQLEPIYKQIYDFCTFTHHEHHKSIIMVLMNEANPVIERRLFECGVDDIAAGKQTLPAVLMSRIKKRLIKRSPLQTTNKIILKNGVIIDLERREVRFNGFNRKLKGISDKLFRYFLKNHHRVISREELVRSHIWDDMVCQPGKIEGGRAVDMAVLRLRRLIEPDPSNPQIIIAVYGIGWILAKDAIA